MKFVVAGAGAIGGYVGAKMAHAGMDVTLFARGPHCRAMQEQGVRVQSAEGDFEAGIEMALRTILTSTEFIFRIERDPEGVAPNRRYHIGDIELASRLSFFLWSSIPDDELLDLAAQGKLHEPAILERQVRRMLADARSQSLVTNFGGQWLYLRNLADAGPDGRIFPDFDDNVR